MSFNLTGLIINNIALSVNASFKEAFSVAKKRLRSVGISTEDVLFDIFKRSIDARKKNDIKLVYSVLARGSFGALDEGRLKAANISLYTKATPQIEYGQGEMDGRVVVVGAGPCGLFCSLLLAESGYAPLILERGGSVTERKRIIDEFKRTRILDTSTNIQFGAGGAGTFSDGKLVTRINDSLTNYVLEKFVEFGAPADILVSARPHIGTDILSVVIDRMIDKIVSLGGEIMYHTRFIDYKAGARGVSAVITDKGEIACSDLVLAVGHSARDTYETLIDKGLDIIPKAFSVGMRIEHLAEDIDKAMYGDFAGHPALGHAEYNLSYNTKERGVYTFCMCPGGVVVAATSEEGGVVTNGMSYHTRSSRNSNCAVLSTVFTSDHGGTSRSGIDFQRRIERLAYISGGSDYSAPIMTVGDFLNKNYCTSPSRVIPSYMDGDGVRLASAEDFLPSFVTENIRGGLVQFDRQISGFASKDAILTGAETRTSAPVRILRVNGLGFCQGIPNLYPSGEGAGYAGGITSAAIDGLKTALSILKKYRPR